MVYAPGQDNPGSGPTGSFNPANGAGGWFAKTIQGATPKYAQNTGARGDTQHRNTLARIFVKLDATEMGPQGLFQQSIADTQVKNFLSPRLTGANFDPNQAQGGQRSGAASGTSGQSGSRSQSSADVHTSGYLDFLITNLQMQLQEKMQVTETLSDNYVAFFFGQNAPVWPVSGMLLNSVQDDQASNFLRLYMAILRGTQMARRQKSMSLRFDSFVVNGVMTNINLAYKSDNELLIPFSFNLLVKRIFITNYTRNWNPTTAVGAFAADPHVVPSDGRPIEASSQTSIVAVAPSGTEATPTGQSNGTDSRTQQATPSANSGTQTPNGVTNNALVSSSSPTPIPTGPANTQSSSGTTAVSSTPETASAPGVSTNPDVRPSRPGPGGQSAD